MGQEFARPRRGHPPVEVGDQGQRPRPARRFPSSRRGVRCLRCFRQRPHRPAPRRPAGAGPCPERTGARRASRADWPEPAGCGRHQRRREPTAAPFGCRRSGATAPARRRRRGTRPAQVEQHRRLPEAVIRASCRSRARGSSHPEPEDRDAGRAKRRISPPPANNPLKSMRRSDSGSCSEPPTTPRADERGKAGGFACVDGGFGRRVEGARRTIPGTGAGRVIAAS